MRALWCTTCLTLCVFGLSLAQAAVAQTNGSPPISSSPITPSTSESRRAPSLRIITQNLECDFQKRMQRVSAPLISAPRAGR
jgi:hypothetical protein